MMYGAALADSQKVLEEQRRQQMMFYMENHSPVLFSINRSFNTGFDQSITN